MCLGIFFQSIAGICSVGTLIVSRTHLRLITNSLTIAISLTVGYFATIYFGVIGVAIGFVVGKIFSMIVDTYISSKSFYIEWHNLLIIAMISLATILTLFIRNFIVTYTFKFIISILLILIYSSLMIYYYRRYKLFLIDSKSIWWFKFIFQIIFYAIYH